MPADSVTCVILIMNAIRAVVYMQDNLWLLRGEMATSFISIIFGATAAVIQASARSDGTLTKQLWIHSK